MKFSEHQQYIIDKMKDGAILSPYEYQIPGAPFCLSHKGQSEPINRRTVPILEKKGAIVFDITSNSFKLLIY